jgi:hypothetical protein
VEARVHLSRQEPSIVSDDNIQLSRLQSPLKAQARNLSVF